MTPEGWARSALGEILIHLGRGTSPKYAVEASPVRAVNQKCIRNGSVTLGQVRPHEPKVPVKPESVLRPGDVCVNSTGTGTIGRVGLWEAPTDGTYFVDTHVTIARPNPARVVPKFLTESLLAPWIQREMEVTCFTGSTNQIELSKSAFAALSLLVPPLGEQRKIAAILSSVDDAIEATQAIIDQLQVVKKAMMAELLTRGLPGRHTRFKMTEIGEVPEEWELVKLGDVISEGPTNGLYKPASQIGRGALVAGMTAIDGNSLDWSLCRRAELNAAEVARYGLRTRDLLVTRVYANVEGIGRFILVPEPPEAVGYESNMMRVRVDVGRASPEFVSAHMGLADARREIEQRATLGAQASINNDGVRSLALRLPPIAEQNAVVEILRAVDVRLLAETEERTGLSKVRSALRSVLLTGEVRVKPDEQLLGASTEVIGP